MKKTMYHIHNVSLLIALSLLLVFGFSTDASAQMMMQGQNPSGDEWQRIVAHTEEEEIEGKEVFDALASGSRECGDLTEEDYGVLGEYFMGEMTGDSHASMNAMLIRMHGEEGEEEIHIALGKRFSGCGGDEIDDALLSGYPMMGVGGMHGGRDMYGFGSDYGRQDGFGSRGFGFMHSGGFGYGLGAVNNFLVTILLIVGIFLGIKWLRTPRIATTTSIKNEDQKL